MSSRRRERAAGDDHAQGHARMSASTPPTPSSTRHVLAATTLLALWCTAPAAPVQVLTNEVQLRCDQPRALRLECDYRLLSGAGTLFDVATAAGVTTLQVQARIGDLELPSPTLEPRDADALIAVLMLVDTSDPRRSAAVARAGEHVRAIVDAGTAGYRFGLAGFDSELRVVAPLGASAEEVHGAAALLQARGKTTELYRNALAAVRLLADFPAARRALVVFSDGLAEDRAYYHEDVVRAAVDSGVVISGIGYPRSVDLSVELQTLRRLADETGGSFVAGNPSDYGLPAEFATTVLAGLGTGGRLTVALDNANAAGLSGLSTVRMEWGSSPGGYVTEIPVTLPPPTAPEPVIKVIEVEVPKVVEVPVRADPPAADASAEAPQPAGAFSALTGWYGPAMLAAGVLAVTLLLGINWRLRRRLAEAQRDLAPMDDAAASPPAASPPADARLGFIELEDDPGQGHAVGGSPFRIGRQSDNDLVLRDPSISRHHAEIRRRPGGSYTVVDLESMNGVVVNGRKKGSSRLADGDLLELGDVAMRFRLRRADDFPVGETVVLRAVVPEPPLSQHNDEEDADDARKLR
jgi:hypothetical protein